MFLFITKLFCATNWLVFFGCVWVINDKWKQNPLMLTKSNAKEHYLLPHKLFNQIINLISFSVTPTILSYLPPVVIEASSADYSPYWKIQTALHDVVDKNVRNGLLVDDGSNRWVKLIFERPHTIYFFQLLCGVRIHFKLKLGIIKLLVQTQVAKWSHPYKVMNDLSRNTTAAVIRENGLNSMSL